jgi:hypothetical protein
MAQDPGLLKLLNSIVDAKYDLKIRSSTPNIYPSVASRGVVKCD